VIAVFVEYPGQYNQLHLTPKKNLHILESKSNAFFSVNVVARKPEKNHPETNPYLIKFLRQIPWKPMKLAVFAGKIDYQKYKFWDRLMIRLIMWMTKGPTDPKTNIDFTNWSQVEDFGQVISEI
jgi:menaquinone-dependent protoporphyrinogen oxidase